MDKGKKEDKFRHIPDLAAAAIAALLVHLLLLVLFHHAPVTGDVQTDHSAFITQMPLNNAANRDLAQWAELNDPSLMVAVNRRSGFSSVLNKVNKPRTLNDLPMAPGLSNPRTPVLSDVQCSLPGSSVLPGDTVFLQKFQSGRSNLVTLTLNDRKLNGLDALRKKLSGNMPRSAAHQPTVVFVAPPAQSAWQGGLHILQSSGSDELDRRALSGANLLLAMPQMANISGELAFIWPATGGNGGKK